MIKWILLLAAGAMAQQVYDNPSLNAHYETPAGWTMEKPDTSYGVVHIRATRVGLKPVDIWFEKYSITPEAFLDRQSLCFSAMVDFYKRCSSSTIAPIIPYMSDTTFSSGVGSSGFNMRHIALDKHLVCYATSFKFYTQEFCYETTMSDFDTSHDLYAANWLKTNFISTALTTTKIAAPTLSQAEEKQIFIDALGRKSGINAPRIPQFLMPR